MRSVSIMVAGSVLLASGWSQGSAGDAPGLDALIADPQHYHLEFQNQWVRVIREKMGPRENTQRHRHAGGVVVFLTDQNVSETSGDGSARVVRHQAGDVIWSPASTHKDENLNNAMFEYVEVEPTTRAGAAVAPPSAAENRLEAALVDPKHYRVEFENELVRVIRFPMEPHDKTLLHTHPSTGAVIVALTDQNTRQTLADGTAREIRHGAGEAWWGAPNIAHQDENASGTRAVVIRIELKQAR
jgi:quercetin dioxygenase-like cupin family protein